MAQVTIRINGVNYVLACKDGEETHLNAMAAELDRRVEAIRQVAGPAGEGRLLVMAGLVLADDLYEARKKLADLESRPTAAPARANRRLSRAVKRAEEIASELDRS
jgi:cell division protein ZapA